MRRNSSDLILFNDRTDLTVLNHISRVRLGNSQLLGHAMTWLNKNIPAKVDRYLHVESNPQVHLPAYLRVRSQIFPGSDGVVHALYFSMT